MNFEDKINELKIKLPKAADPVGSYVAAKISNKMLFISGQISINEKGELINNYNVPIINNRSSSLTTCFFFLFLSMLSFLQFSFCNLIFLLFMLF